MSRQNLAACLIVGCTAIFPLTARAQQFGADTLYNSGVQAYFRGCSAEAESSFSSLMGVDPNDPRAYYFRALSLMRQGREDEARSDMEIGAQIEARSPHRFDIGKTLERVQGPTRLVLEQYRNRARTAASMTPPIGAVRSPDAAVLREQRVVPLDEFSRPGDPQSIAPPVAAPAKPPQTFAPPAASPPKPASDSTAAPAGGENPFGDDAGSAAKPQPKTAPPAKAAAPESPPAKAVLPPAPKPAAPAPTPKPSDTDAENPF